MYMRVAFLAFVVMPTLASAGECWQCKLHGDCPLPNFRELMNCSREEDHQEKALIAPPKVSADARKWVDTPCGRIRASQDHEEASKENETGR